MEPRSVTEHHEAADKFERYYDLLRRDYRLTSFTYGRRRIDELLQEVLAELPPNGTILDVGCGTGEQLKLFRLLGFQAKGVEPAENMRSIARRNNPGAEIQAGGAAQLSFPAGQFDMVTAFEVFRYLEREEILQSYREMLRVLKPGGRAFFTMVNRYALDGFYLYNGLRTVLARLRGAAPPIHCEFSTPPEIRADLQSLGFAEIRFYGRMMGPLRIAYRIHEGLGARAAGALEGLDQAVSRWRWTIPLAGHLIVSARKPGGGNQSGSSC